MIHLLRQEGETSPLGEAVLEIETSDPAMHDWIPPAAGRDDAVIHADSRGQPRVGLAART